MDPEVKGVFDYEVMMFRFLSTKKIHADCVELENAITESRLLHTRILADILTSKTRPSRKGVPSDDIILADLVSDWENCPDISALVTNLKSAYGDYAPGTYCWELNKHFAHATKNRTTWHSYENLFLAIDPIINELIDKIYAKIT